jgi:hypothetical protein
MDAGLKPSAYIDATRSRASDEADFRESAELQGKAAFS